MKKVPLRKCVATGVLLPKKDLIRVVLNNQGEIFIDPTSKQNGRGAYIAKDIEAVLLAKKNKSLARSLKVKVADEIYEQLCEYINQSQ